MVAVGIERIEELKVSQPTRLARLRSFSQAKLGLSAWASADTSVTYAPARQGVFLGPWIHAASWLQVSGEKRGPQKRTADQLSSSWGGQDHDRWHFSDACEARVSAENERA